MDIRKFDASTQAQKRSAYKERARMWYYTQGGKEYQSRHQKQIREQWWTILHDRGMDRCSICGYSKCRAALDFHHVNGKDSTLHLMAILKNFKPSKERLKELDNVVCLCSNCHRELHDKRRVENAALRVRMQKVQKSFREACYSGEEIEDNVLLWRVR